MRYPTKNEAVHAFVGEFNAIRTDIVSFLIKSEPDDWEEVTMPAVYDKVYVYDEEEEGEITRVIHDNDTYLIELDNGKDVVVEISEFEVLRDDMMPMWGYMWSFGDQLDEDWLADHDGVRVMSEIGFRVYHSDEYGYFFGIDGAGFDFYEAFWTPLYDARGLQWHDEEDENGSAESAM